MTKRTILLATVAAMLTGPARAYALKSTVDSLDDIPEALHAEYVEQGGKFVLQVDGMKPQAEFDRVQGALTKEKGEHSTLKQRITSTLGDRKFEDVVTELDKIDEYKAAADGKLDEDKINSIVEGRVKTRIAPIERERDGLKTKVGELEGAVQGFTVEKKTRTIHDQVRRDAKKAGVTDEALDDALLLADRIFEIREDDGKVVVRDQVGFTPGIEPSVFFVDIQAKKPHWFGPSGGSGAGGKRETGGGGGVNPWTHDGWNMTEQGRIYQDNPTKAEQLAKLAGHKGALGVSKPVKK